MSEDIKVADLARILTEAASSAAGEYDLHRAGAHAALCDVALQARVDFRYVNGSLVFGAPEAAPRPALPPEDVWHYMDTADLARWAEWE